MKVWYRAGEKSYLRVICPQPYQKENEYLGRIMLRKFPTIFAEQDLLERIIEERERHLYIPCELIFA